MGHPRRTNAPSLPLLTCVCLLASTRTGAFAPNTRTHTQVHAQVQSSAQSQSPSLLRSSLRGDEDGTYPSRPQSRPRPANDDRIRKSPPRHPFFDRADPSRFDLGDDLEVLRQEVAEMESRYAQVVEGGFFRTAALLQEKLAEKRGRDAEFVYSEAVCNLNEAAAVEDGELEGRCREEREAARRSMPQFNLHGLWVGRYGGNGRENHEMINITYAGDTLIATKVTGDCFVPRGEVSFTVDLQPRNADFSDQLPPVHLEEAAGSQWGARYLPRFIGRGHVADEGYKEVAWVDGQLVLVGDYFSFAWLPQRHQIIFGRPSGELAIKMLRDYISEEDEAEKAREGARALAERMYTGDVGDGAGLEWVGRRISKQRDLRNLEGKKKSI